MSQQTDEQAERLEQLANAKGFKDGSTIVFLHEQLCADLAAGAAALRGSPRSEDVLVPCESCGWPMEQPSPRSEWRTMVQELLDNIIEQGEHGDDHHEEDCPTCQAIVKVQALLPSAPPEVEQ